jgi:hypothetical protein
MTKSKKDKEARPNEGKEMTDKEIRQAIRDAPVTLQEFKKMAKRGRIRGDDDDPLKPSKLDKKKARTGVDQGRIHGYSEDDIACFYLRVARYLGYRRDAPEAAYVLYVFDLKVAKFPPSEPLSEPGECPTEHRHPHGRADARAAGHRAGSRLATARRPVRSSTRPSHDAVADLLGDLMHWCDRHKMSFNDELDRARRYYDEEIANPDEC